MDEGASLSLPQLSALEDSRLGEPSDTDFADTLYDRAMAIANDLYDPDAYALLGVPPEERIEREIAYLRRRSFGEWYFGAVTPARQITLLPDSEVLLKLRLTQQIVEETRHYEIFAAAVKRRNGEWRLQRYSVPSHLREMLSTQVSSASAAELAAANQYSGEVVLSVHDRQEKNVLRLVTSPDIMKDIETIEADEPAHIAIGRDLVRMYAGDIRERRAMARAQEDFLMALSRQHVAELEALGLQRLRGLPVFAPATPPHGPALL
ncbi:hypothetical protein [Streptomyces sp. NPDC001985]|uniref:hypothetical protein n=1 Tax=Streptomyces sp. NPDC001985 TaxID=3154406 RepID=UPI00331A0F42